MINSEEYQRYIESIVRKIVGMFPGAQLCKEDLRQRGWLELIRAAGTYDADRDAELTTYAYKAVAAGIRREAFFQIDRSGVTGKDGAADCVSIDEGSGVIRKLSEEAFFRSEAEHTDREKKEQLREDLQLLTEQEKRVLCMAYGIGCERCADAGKIAGALHMRELEVRRALQSGKRKLEDLADGRK